MRYIDPDMNGVEAASQGDEGGFAGPAATGAVWSHTTMYVVESSINALSIENRSCCLAAW